MVLLSLLQHAALAKDEFSKEFEVQTSVNALANQASTVYSEFLPEFEIVEFLTEEHSIAEFSNVSHFSTVKKREISCATTYSANSSITTLPGKFAWLEVCLTSHRQCFPISDILTV